MKPVNPPLPLLWLLYGPLLLRVSTATCYYPNGNPATDDVQCTSGDKSACCGSGSICLSNGLCMGIVQPFGLSRGSCTDPSFEIDECTNACTNIQRNGGCAIIPYNNTEEGVYYCCNSIVNNSTGPRPSCAWDTDPFTLQSATIIPGAALLENYAQVSDSDTTNTSTAEQNKTVDCLNAGTNTSSSNSKEVAIGAGVGVPLGVLALAGIAWALYERRQRLQSASMVSSTSNLASIPAYSSVSEEFHRKGVNQENRHSQPFELAESTPALSGNPRFG
ncbi:uncharacterized protein DSM5745_06282 [Aspergillus mulundensis]|uniref:Mid2 domain-containing protein n=1 Tax=Aspergillus mulundensis TaxID=1810919 RepID=A0A3D8RQP8_9EURO|nr:Uncharacterized protein DSM5745_06282 [Aspergillus mulundensis]RDW76290.1 Uncharacterized protein DSM5745_06282 [Aspergillus mulundensis]